MNKSIWCSFVKQKDWKTKTFTFAEILYCKNFNFPKIIHLLILSFQKYCYILYSFIYYCQVDKIRRWTCFRKLNVLRQSCAKVKSFIFRSFCSTNALRIDLFIKCHILVWHLCTGQIQFFYNICTTFLIVVLVVIREIHSSEVYLCEGS